METKKLNTPKRQIENRDRGYCRACESETRLIRELILNGYVTPSFHDCEVIDVEDVKRQKTN